MPLPEKFSEVQEFEGTKFGTAVSNVAVCMKDLTLVEQKQVLTECLMAVMKLIEDEKRKLLANLLDPEGSDL